MQNKKLKLILVVILIVVAVTVFLITKKRSGTDVFFVNGATFSTINFTDSLNREMIKESMENPNYTDPIFPVQKHWIKSGQGYVFGIREFKDPIPVTKDDEQYKKITIWLNDLNQDQNSFGDRSKVIGYFNKGASAWPDKSCSGEILNGTVKILSKENNEIRLSISGTVDCKSEQITIDSDEKFHELKIDNVTPWLGAKGEFIYKETYR